jgi:RNA polymerase sigma-70 factor (ECF subfamily)
MAVKDSVASAEEGDSGEVRLAPNRWPQELLTGFRQGSREALTRVYQRHCREIAALLQHGFSFSAGDRNHRFAGYNSAFDMQDALHETFRKAFEPRAREAYDGIRPYGPYLRTIARNVVLTRLRARELLLPGVDLPDGPLQGDAALSPAHAEPPPSPERAMHQAQTRELVADFLSTLSAQDRELVDCRFVRGHSQRDAARELRIGRQRLRTHERRIKRALLNYLRSRGESSLVEGTHVVAVLLGTTLAGSFGEVLR